MLLLRLAGLSELRTLLSTQQITHLRLRTSDLIIPKVTAYKAGTAKWGKDGWRPDVRGGFVLGNGNLERDDVL